MANEIKVELDLDTLEAIKELGAFAKKSQVAGEKAGSSFAKSFGASLLGNIGADLVGKALRSIGNEFGKLTKAAINIEVIETQFKTMLGSVEAADKQIRDLQSFAATTPFQLEGLALSTRQLISFGVAQENVLPTLQKLGDLAAGVGVSIEDLTIPFGRLQATQKLNLVELDKFVDKGINLYQMFADSTGMAIAEVRDAVSKGKIPFSEFEKALTSLTSEGGTFFNSMQKQSETLEGRISTLGDVLTNFRANLGKLFSPLIKKGVDILIDLITKIGKSFEGLTLSSIQRELVLFNQSVIDFLIRPLELFLNAGNLVFDGIKLGLQGLVAGVGFAGRKLAEFLGMFGMDNALTQGLNTFADSSAEVFNQMSAEASRNLESIFETPIADKAEIFNQELGTALDTTTAIVTEKTGQAAAAVTENTDKAFITFQNIAKGMEQTARRLGGILNQTLAMGISKSIQSVITSIGKGEDAFANFGKLVLGVVGDMAIKLGETLILSGIGIESLKALGGSAAIAAGAGLVAIGTIIKAAAGSGGGATGGGSVGGGTGALATDTGAGTFEDDDVEERRVASTINIEVQGSLVQQEELGAFIAEVQNESREKNGIIDTNVRTA